MKIISFSIFNQVSPDEPFVMDFYLRGLYFNARMNKLLYPSWITFCAVSQSSFANNTEYLHLLRNLFCVSLTVFDDASLCESMLWRMIPVFDNDTTHVLCRDADAITTYREAQAVGEWVDSGLGFHGITDNPAHTQPLMGGMIGIKTDKFRKAFPGWTTFNEMIAGRDLSERGSDQNFLRQEIYPKVRQTEMFAHYFQGLQHSDEAICKTIVDDRPLPGVSPRLWESNLTCRHIGSAGVVEMELLRFFNRFDKNPKYDEFERQFPKLFYWTK